MSWKIEIKPTAIKEYSKLDKPTKKRIKNSLLDLESEVNPFTHKNVRQLTGKLKGDYRLRVGDWRILFTPDFEEKVLYVYAILSRGKAY